MAGVKKRIPALRFVTAVALLVALAPATQAAAACAGWSSSAAERMACCKRSAECASISSDACCADDEQRQNAQVASIVVVSPGPIISLPLPVTHSAASHQLVHQPPVSSTGRKTHLLDSVFLI
jgi:hypothetical protein